MPKEVGNIEIKVLEYGPNEHKVFIAAPPDMPFEWFVLAAVHMLRAAATQSSMGFEAAMDDIRDLAMESRTISPNEYPEL